MTKYPYVILKKMRIDEQIVERFTNTVYSRIRRKLHEGKPIGQFHKNMSIDIVLDKTFHSFQRQTRHGMDERRFISDNEIIETVRRASGQIIDDILFGKIRMGRRFIVHDTNTNLNIVCSPSGDEEPLIISIITVMRTENFNNQFGTYTINI